MTGEKVTKPELDRMTAALPVDMMWHDELSPHALREILTAMGHFELLEALTALRDAVDRYFGPSKAGAAWPKYFDPEMHAAWAAIRKATGEA